ncbi:MAG: alkaline phosphatase D family protein [Bdellovibrionota bacterium]
MHKFSKDWIRKAVRSFYCTATLVTLGCASSGPSTSVNTPVSPRGSYGETSKINSSSADGNSKISDRKNPVIPRGIDYTVPPARIAFGSCADQDKPQPIWTAILKEEPDMYIAAGDNVYASAPGQTPISEQYIKLDQIPEYRELREDVPMMAIWDDHDYGMNDGGRENPEKEIAKRDFLNYWGYVKDSIALGQGPLYHAKMIGGPIYQRIEKVRRGRKRKARKARIVSKPGSSVQVIMLDTRWNRTPLLKAEGNDPLRKYLPNTDPKATILGNEQWSWLEDQMAKPADIKVLVSSIQVIAEGHGFEKWGNFPLERDRLFELIKKTKPKNLFIISGDRHLGTIAKTEIPGWGTLYDITASSLNKPSNLEESDSAYVGASYQKENYGLATIEWEKKEISLELKDLNGGTVNTVKIPLK